MSFVVRGQIRQDRTRTFHSERRFSRARGNTTAVTRCCAHAPPCSTPWRRSRAAR